MPLIRQNAKAECGFLCIAMVSAFHGRNLNSAELSNLSLRSSRGANLRHLVEFASDLNLASRAIKCGLNELKIAMLPCILHWDFNHFIVLEHVKGDSLFILDPAKGRRKIRIQEASKHYTGILLEISPGEAFKKQLRERKARPLDFIPLARYALSPLVLSIALSLGLQAIMLLGPFYLQLVIDRSISFDNVNLLHTLVIVFLCLKAFEFFVGFLRNLIVQYTTNAISFDMVSRLKRNLFRLPISYFQTRSIGDVLERFHSLDPIRSLIVSGALNVGIDGLLAILLVVVLLNYSALLTSIVLMGIVIYIALRVIFYSFIRSRDADAIEAKAEEATVFVENLRGIHTIRSNQMSAEREAKWRNRAADAINADIRAGTMRLLYRSLKDLLAGLAFIIVVYFAAVQIIDDNFSIGMLTAFLAYASQLESRARALVDLVVDYNLLSVHVDRVTDIVLTETEDDPPASSDRAVFTGKIELSAVGFSYSKTGPSVLRNINLQIEPGDKLLVLGPSGHGKSTLLRLIMQQYRPSSGNIEYDGHHADTWNKNQLFEKVRHVLQDDVLLPGSILKNLTCFSEAPDFEHVQHCLRLVGMEREVNNMPMQLNSIIDDMGSNLSGGQRQRLCIARALYQNPSLLILDEATSNLDEDNERHVMHSLSALDIGLIVVSHRPSLRQFCDKVLRVQNGELTDASELTVDN